MDEPVPECSWRLAGGAAAGNFLQTARVSPRRPADGSAVVRRPGGEGVDDLSHGRAGVANCGSRVCPAGTGMAGTVAEVGRNMRRGDGILGADPSTVPCICGG